MSPSSSSSVRSGPNLGFTLSPLARQRLLFAALCIVWGANWLAMKAGVATVPPGIFSGTRWTFAGLVLLGWWRLQGGSFRIAPRVLLHLVLVSLILISVNAVIMLYGLRYVPVGLAAVINAGLTPVAMLGFGIGFGLERFRLRQLLAFALGIGGILVLFGPKAIEGRLDYPQLLGCLAIIVGNLFYCYGSVAARPLMRVVSPVLLTATTNFAGGFILLIFSLLFEPGVGQAMTFHWGAAAWAGWLFMVFAGSLGATIIYFFLVRDWGPGRTGTYAFVSPVIAILLGMAVYGERLDVIELGGMVLMLAGAAVALRRA
jgi:drug/metabolite transporter (DMT)-like permease